MFDEDLKEPTSVVEKDEASLDQQLQEKLRNPVIRSKLAELGIDMKTTLGLDALK